MGKLFLPKVSGNPAGDQTQNFWIRSLVLYQLQHKGGSSQFQIFAISTSITFMHDMSLIFDTIMSKFQIFDLLYDI